MLMVRSGKVLSIKGHSSHQNMNLYHPVCHFYMMVSVYSTMYCIADFFFIVQSLNALIFFFVVVLGKPMQLSLAAEEVATFYAKMLDHEYTTKETFQSNFFTDWREVRSFGMEAIYLLSSMTFSGFAVRNNF